MEAWRLFLSVNSIIDRLFSPVSMSTSALSASSFLAVSLSCGLAVLLSRCLAASLYHSYAVAFSRAKGYVEYIHVYYPYVSMWLVDR